MIPIGATKVCSTVIRVYRVLGVEMSVIDCVIVMSVSGFVVPVGGAFVTITVAVLCLCDGGITPSNCIQHFGDLVVPVFTFIIFICVMITLDFPEVFAP